MYAIIEDSGTQFRVGKEDVIHVDLRDADEQPKTIEFDKVMLIGGGKKPKIGQPYVKGAKVTAEVLEELRGDKITIVKFKRRKGYKRTRGHRQGMLKIKINDIAG